MQKKNPEFYFLPLLEHFKQGTSLQLKIIKMVPPLLIYLNIVLVLYFFLKEIFLDFGGTKGDLISELKLSHSVGGVSKLKHEQVYKSIDISTQ